MLKAKLALRTGAEDLPRVRGRVGFSFGPSDKLIVDSCPFCQAAHESTVERGSGPRDIPQLAGCGRGAYLIEVE